MRATTRIYILPKFSLTFLYCSYIFIKFYFLHYRLLLETFLWQKTEAEQLFYGCYQTSGSACWYFY